MPSRSKRWRFRQQRQISKEIAERRILTLFDMALQTSDHKRAAEYIHLARKIASRVRMKVPRSLQQLACDSCHSPLRPGLTAVFRVRSQPRRLVIRCKACGRIKRRPLG